MSGCARSQGAQAFAAAVIDVMHVVRAHADVWYRRWELYRSAELLRVLPLQSLVHDGAESVVENVLVARGINVGEFPGTMFLSCCEEREAQLV